MKKRLANPVVWVVVALVVAGALVLWSSNRGSDPEKLNLGEFQTKVVEGQVDEATINDGDNTVTGTLADGTDYAVNYPAEYSPEITQLLIDNGVDPETDPQHPSIWMDLLWTFLPVLLLCGMVVWLVVSIGGDRMGFGRAKARRLTKDEPKVSFADVAGCDEAVEELTEIRDFLEDPQRFAAMGARVPKGVLLYGPPGTGKTLLARAVAGEAGVPFFSISGSDFVEMFVGVGASRVRNLFEQAKQEAPAIIFVDEIDAVGRHRGSGVGGGHDEREQTLNQLLVEMDGFGAGSGIILIAATNRPDILDPALLRPGRFDRQIVVDQPDLEGRRAILEVHAKGKPIATDVDLGTIARRTPGFTGADLANTVNEAAILATRRDETEINASELEEAIDRVMAGPERRSRVMSDREKLVIAYHEAGHALVGHLLPNTDPIHKVSIVARGRALGWTLALPTEDRNIRTRSELRDDMAMMLGGRTAEELIFGDPTTGAQNDIERATQVARAMVTQFGMSDELGPWQLGTKGGEPFVGKEAVVEPTYSDEIAAAIDTEVRRLLDLAHDEARELLTLHRVTLDRLAEALVEHETLDDEQLSVIFAAADAAGPAATPAVPARPSPSPRTTGPSSSAAGSAGPTLASGTSAADTSPAPASGPEHIERHPE